MALTQIDDRGLKTPIDLLDNEKIRFGTGNDLQIYHTGAQANIRAATGQGSLWLTGDQIELINGAVSENMLIATQNAAVKLYYDNSKKFETTSDGAQVTGKLFADNGFWCKDNDTYRCGDATDMMIWHDGSNSYIKNDTGGLFIQGGTQNNSIYIRPRDGENSIQANSNGSVDLYYNNSKKFETTSSGVSVSGDIAMTTNDINFGDTGKLQLGGSQDLQIYHDGISKLVDTSGNLHIGTNSFALKRQGLDETMLTGTANGSIELYYDNSKKFETTSSGTKFTQSLVNENDGADNGIYLGAGNDFRFYHDGSNNQIVGTGNHFIRFWTANTIRFNITNDGHFRPETDNVSDLGASNQRFKDLYISNDIDIIDNSVLKIGTGDDLNIWHDGTYNWIDSVNNHDLVLKAGTGDVYIQGSDIFIGDEGANEKYIDAHKDGSVELYYDNSKKFETTSHGADFHSTAPAIVGIHSTDGGNTSEARIALGALSSNPPEQRGVQVVAYNMNAGHHMDLRTSSTHSAGPTTKMRIQNDGHITIPNDSKQLQIGAGNDLYLYSDGSNGIIRSPNNRLYIQSDSGVNLTKIGNVEKYLECDSNGAVKIYYDDAKKFETDSFGVSIQGDCLKVPDGSAGSPGFTWNNEGNADTGIYRPGANQIGFTSAGNACLRIDNGYTWTPTGMALRVGTDSAVSSELFTAVKDGGKVAFFHKVGSADDVGVTMRHGRGLSGYEGRMVLFERADGTTCGTITIGASATAYNTSSDYRLKENQVSISDGITRLKTLKPYRFNFKDEPEKTVDGFFAHEVTAVPEATTGTKDEVDSDGKPVYQGIDQSKLVPLLTAALQEAIAKIETLETKVAALEAG